jgi:hypothetical protein
METQGLKSLGYKILRVIVLSLAVLGIKKYIAYAAFKSLRIARAKKIRAEHHKMTMSGRDPFFRDALYGFAVTGKFMHWDLKRDTLNNVLLTGITLDEYKRMTTLERDQQLVEYVVERHILITGDIDLSTATLVYRFTYKKTDTEYIARFIEAADEHKQQYGINHKPGTQPVAYPLKQYVGV